MPDATNSYKTGFAAGYAQCSLDANNYAKKADFEMTMDEQADKECFKHFH